MIYLNHIITGDEAWGVISHYARIKGVYGADTPPHQKADNFKPQDHVLIFLRQKGHLLVDVLLQGTIINAVSYNEILKELHHAIQDKWYIMLSSCVMYCFMTVLR